MPLMAMIMGSLQVCRIIVLVITVVMMYDDIIECYWTAAEMTLIRSWTVMSKEDMGVVLHFGASLYLSRGLPSTKSAAICAS